MLTKVNGRVFEPAVVGQPAIPPSAACVPVYIPPIPPRPPTSPTPPPTPPPTSGTPNYIHTHGGTQLMGVVRLDEYTCLYGVIWSCCGQWATTPARWVEIGCD